MRFIVASLIALATLANARFRGGRRPDSEGPSNSPNGPDDFPGGGTGYGGLGSDGESPVASQEEIELNMGNLEAKLKKSEDALEFTEGVVDVTVQVVYAILADPDCVDGDTFSEGGMAIGTSTQCVSAACKCAFML
jgi:hypothetical protein